MKHAYSFLSTKAFIVLAIYFGLTVPMTASAQGSTCGPIVENFDNTGGTMAGFTSSTVHSTAAGFTYNKPAADGYLQRCNIPSGSSVYEIVTPTFVSLASQTAVGYGFELSGIVNVSRVVVLLQYSDNSGNVNTVEVENFAPSYSGPTEFDIASICKSVAINSFTGFTPGEPFRFIFQFTSGSASGAGQCMTFDDFRTTGVNAQAPLPVTFTNFTAKRSGSAVQTIWNVAGEKDVARYEIERSVNRKDFIKVGEVSADGKTAYSFTDNAPVSGVSFYRVRNIDLDTRSKYTPIARVNLNKKISLRAFPIPAATEVNIEHGSVGGKGTLTITTTDGRVVRSLEIKPDVNLTTISLVNLKSGLYIIRFNDGSGNTESFKLVKQ
jgi:hypothetical protein